MKSERAEGLAAGYAWGREDARKGPESGLRSALETFDSNANELVTRAEAGRCLADAVRAYLSTPAVTAQPGDESGDYAFSREFAAAWAEYNLGRRGMMMTVQDAWQRWQATRGATIEVEHDFEYHVLTCARSWLADQPDYADTDVTRLPDTSVRAAMERRYPGGWSTYRRTELAAYYRAG